MPENIKQIRTQLETIQARNNRVEADKAWETSKTRRGLIAVLTYLVLVIFLYSIKTPRPWTNALVPAIGFYLSTLTITKAKRLWWRYYHQ